MKTFIYDYGVQISDENLQSKEISVPSDARIIGCRKEDELLILRIMTNTDPSLESNRQARKIHMVVCVSNTQKRVSIETDQPLKYVGSFALQKLSSWDHRSSFDVFEENE